MEGDADKVVFSIFVKNEVSRIFRLSNLKRLTLSEKNEKVFGLIAKEVMELLQRDFTPDL
jgi:hypothetical protein